MNLFKSILLVVFCLPVCVSAADLSPDQNAAVTVTVADFLPLQGDDWPGALQYRDFSSDRQVSIPLLIRVLSVNESSIDYRIEYPDEPQYNSDERFIITENGTKINEEMVIGRQSDDEVLTITTLSRGKDNGQSAEIRLTYKISSAHFSIEKEVKPDGEDEFFTRNTMILAR